MRENKYKIMYSATFINQFNNILRYFVYELKNKIAAENFYNEVITQIEKRSYNPGSYEKYISNKKRKDIYYRIYIKNFIVFYVVKDVVMEVRRILYSKRNFDKFV